MLEMVPRLADNLCRSETKQVCNTIKEHNLCEILDCAFTQRGSSRVEFLSGMTIQWTPALQPPS